MLRITRNLYSVSSYFPKQFFWRVLNQRQNYATCNTPTKEMKTSQLKLLVTQYMAYTCTVPSSLHLWSSYMYIMNDEHFMYMYVHVYNRLREFEALKSCDYLQIRAQVSFEEHVFKGVSKFFTARNSCPSYIWHKPFLQWNLSIRDLWIKDTSLSSTLVLTTQ